VASTVVPGRYDPTLPRFTQDNVIGKGQKTRAQVFGEPITIDGNGWMQAFCPECGTHIYAADATDPKILAIRTAPLVNAIRSSRRRRSGAGRRRAGQATCEPSHSGSSTTSRHRDQRPRHAGQILGQIDSAGDSGHRLFLLTLAYESSHSQSCHFDALRRRAAGTLGQGSPFTR
jgi:hypothetical protein